MAQTDVIIRNPVLIVGIGSVGGSLAAQAGKVCGCDSLHVDYEGKESVGSNLFFHISTDGWINPSILKLRSFAQSSESGLREIIKNYRTVFLISNLAGRGGASIGPILSRIAKSLECSVISLATMPFGFEHDRRFSSGVALKRLRESSNSVIVIDNEAFLQNNPNSTQEECFSLTNKCVVDIASHLAKTGIGSEELNIATTSRPTAEGFNSALENSISALYPQLSKTATVQSAVLHVMGGSVISLGKVREIVDHARGAFSENGTAQVTITSLNSSGESQVHVVASVSNETRFDNYDPLSQIIPKDNVLDWDELETSCDVPLSVSNVE